MVGKSSCPALAAEISRDLFIFDGGTVVGETTK